MTPFLSRDGMHLWYADARRVSEFIEPDSVDLIITSPPYFALRSYTDGGEHYDGQIGSEPTPREFVDALIECTADWLTVLKPGGSIFVNLGDKYAGSGGHNNSGVTGGPSQLQGASQRGRSDVQATRRSAPDRYNQASDGIPAKSLMGLPWRYALRCIDDLGLILRAEIIWCLSGGARIYARIGGRPRPIMLRDLVRSYKPEDVQLWNGQKWTQVLGWNPSTDTDDALELELRSGERIGCTRGHQWPTSRGLLRAEDVRIGDVIDTTTLPDGDRHPDLLPDDDIGWFVGMYLAEGSRSGTTIQIAGHLDETERRYRLSALADAYDGTWNVYQTSDNGATCNMHSPALSGILDRYVSPGTAHTKRLTMHAWQRSNTFLAAVVTGYLEGDGHYDAKNDRWRLGFCSNDELAADLRTLAARLGAKLSLRRNGTGWRGEWRWSESDHWNTKTMGEVVAIRNSRARQFFDVGVADEPHLFALASGVLTHNSKPNGLPESVTDRVRRSHEQWFHLTRQGRYYAAVDEVREPQASDDRRPGVGGRWMNGIPEIMGSDTTQDHRGRLNQYTNPLGKLPGSVWSIPSEPLQVPKYRILVDGEPVAFTTPGADDDDSLAERDALLRRHAHRNPTWDALPDHFAAFPTEWPRRLILGWSPNGICVECGEGRRPVVAKELVAHRHNLRADHKHSTGEGIGPDYALLQYPVAHQEATITGYACACSTPDDAPTRPAVILDPFGGTGTVALVARALGRHAHHVDLSHDYLRLAEWRIWSDTNAFRKASERSGIKVPEPPKIDGQLSMLDGVG